MIWLKSVQVRAREERSRNPTHEPMCIQSSTGKSVELSFEMSRSSISLKPTDKWPGRFQHEIATSLMCCGTAKMHHVAYYYAGSRVAPYVGSM